MEATQRIQSEPACKSFGSCHYDCKQMGERDKGNPSIFVFGSKKLTKERG